MHKLWNILKLYGKGMISMATKSTKEPKETTNTKVEDVKPKRSYVRKKPAISTYIEYDDVQLSQENLIEKAKDILSSLNEETDTVKKFAFYIKPTEMKIFFTVDGKGKAEYCIDLKK